MCSPGSGSTGVVELGPPGSGPRRASFAYAPSTRAYGPLKLLPLAASSRAVQRDPSLERGRERGGRRKQREMESVFGLVGDGFAVVAADTSATSSILVHKTNEDKIMKLDSHKLLGASGEPGDRSFPKPYPYTLALFPNRPLITTSVGYGL